MTTEIQAPPQAPPVPSDAPTRVDMPPVPPVAAPQDPLAAAAAGPGQRGRLRRKLLKLKAVQHRQRIELGALVVDARKRANGSRPEVVERRASEAAEVDRQVRELQHAVDAHADTRELVAGVVGSCEACGALLSTEDRFCPSCGAPTKLGRARPVDTTPVEPRKPAPAQHAPPSEAAAPASTPAPPPPPADTPLAHVDRSQIPPPPPPPA